MAGISGQQVADAAREAAVSNALSLLTAEVWAILALLCVGMAAGMALVGLVRIFLPNIDGEGSRAWELRSRFLTQLGAATAGLMTLWIEWAYLAVLVDLSWVLSLPTALIAAIVAAACNRPAFKPVKAIWRWALGLLRKRIEKDHGVGSASDLDDTTFPRKPP